jgi:hypothetical protein
MLHPNFFSRPLQTVTTSVKSFRNFVSQLNQARNIDPVTIDCMMLVLFAYCQYKTNVLLHTRLLSM